MGIAAARGSRLSEVFWSVRWEGWIFISAVVVVALFEGERQAGRFNLYLRNFGL